MSSSNPLLDFSGLPLFDRIAPPDVAPAIDVLLERADAALETVTAPDFPADWNAIASVLDVGMNRNDEGKLCGDVDFEGVKAVAGHITPVPGGVGPMTITMLLVNTMEAAERAAG